MFYTWWGKKQCGSGFSVQRSGLSKSGSIKFFFAGDFSILGGAADAHQVMADKSL
jgi:hypothetical protein